MQRREILKECGLGLAGAAAVTLAGCSSDSSNNSTDGGSDGGDGGGNSTDGGGGTATPSGSNSIEGETQSGKQRTLEIFPDSVKDNVEVVSIEEVEGTDTRVEVDVTLKNTAGEEARMDRYAITITGFTTGTPTGEATDRISASTSTEYKTNEQEPTPAGETVTLGYSLEVPSDSEATIESYKISVACGGVYNPPGCE